MQDILLTDENDLLIADGDFVIGESAQQEVEGILRSFPGWWKQYPVLGCEISNYLDGPLTDIATLQRTIQVQLKSDGKQLISFSSEINSDGTATLTINGQEVDL